MKVLMPAAQRATLEPALPDGVEALWWQDMDEAAALIPAAEVAWIDQMSIRHIGPIVAKGAQLKWLSTMAAGVESLDLAALRERGVTLTNGSGLNAAAVADYALLGILAAAKRYDEVVRHVDRHDWTTDAPGRLELEGTRALVIGMGTIGALIARRLSAFDVAVTGVTRSGRDGTLGPDAWRGELGAFDWVILGAPATGETRAIIGAAELAAMKPTAWIVNIARGDLIDKAALVAALEQGAIAGAFLDTVSPEPLPPGDPLWTAPNCLLSMHLSGRSQTGMMRRAVQLFLDNLHAWCAGAPLRNVVDLSAGY